MARWRLTTPDRQRFAGLLTVESGATTVAQCRDIDRALGWLLGDPAVIARWLHAPHAAFYHVAPLYLILGSAPGRALLRAALLAEAADQGDEAARAAVLQ